MVFVITLLVLTFSLLFWLFKFGALIGFLLILGAIYLTFLKLKFSKFFANYNKHILLTSLIFLGFVTALFCLTNARSYSYDGRIFHMKVVNTVMQTGQYLPLYEKTKPILIELFLGLVGKFFGEYMIYVTFALAAILAIIVTFKFFRILQLSKEKALFLSFILTASPTFFAVSTIEFKIDIFLYVLIVLTYILFCLIITKKSYKFLPLLGLLLGVGILIKLSIIPIAGVLGFCVFYQYFKKDSLRKLLSPILFIVFVVMPYLSYCYFFGTKIPIIQREISIRSETKTLFSVSTNIVNTCSSEARILDYNNYIYGNFFPNYLLQPIYYLTGYKVHVVGLQIMNIPGPILYLSIFLSVFWWFLYRKQSSNLERYLYFVAMFQLFSFYLTVRVVFWYLLPVFPLTLYFSYKVILYACRLHQKLWTFLQIFLFINSLIMFLILFIRTVPPWEFASYNSTFVNMDKENSLFLSNQTSGLIFDSSYQQAGVLYPYFTDSAQRVVKADFLFADEKQPLNQIYEEFRRNDIRYIVANANFSTYPQTNGCLTLYAKRLSTFLNDYTDKNHTNTKTFEVYKLK